MVRNIFPQCRIGFTATILGLIAAIPLLGANNCQAEFRIATVDMGRILNESAEAKERRKELDELSAQARKKIESKKSSLKELEEAVTKKRSEDDERRYREEVRALSRMVKDEEDELRSKFVTVNRDLTQKALGVVKKFAAERKIDLVLDKNSAERGAVLYSLGKVDITEDVIDILDD